MDRPCGIKPSITRPSPAPCHRMRAQWNTESQHDDVLSGTRLSPPHVLQLKCATVTVTLHVALNGIHGHAYFVSGMISCRRMHTGLVLCSVREVKWSRRDGSVVAALSLDCHGGPPGW